MSNGRIQMTEDELRRGNIANILGGFGRGRWTANEVRWLLRGLGLTADEWAHVENVLAKEGTT